MDDLICMEVFECVDNLNSKGFSHQLIDSSLPLDVIVQGIIFTEFEKDVDILSVLENMNKFNHISVAEGTMNSNFAQEFGTLPTLGQVLLGNDLGGGDLFGLLINADIALGETTLPEVLSPLVFSYALLALGAYQFFDDFSVLFIFFLALALVVYHFLAVV